MLINERTRRAMLALAAGTTVAALPAIAAIGPEESSEVDLTVEAHPEHDAKATHKVVIRQKDNNDEYELKMEDDHVIILHNGKNVPANRIERDGAFIILRGDNGDALTEFKIGKAGSFKPGAGNVIVLEDGGQWVAKAHGHDHDHHHHHNEDVKVLKDGAVFEFHAESGDGQPKSGTWVFSTGDGGVNQWVAADDSANIYFDSGETPPVMVGITMSEPSEQLRYHLDIDGPAIMIDQVIDGLPADKAGLQQYDIIVDIEGDDATSGNLQSALSGKEPGDKLKLVVIRGGDRGEIRIKLAAYDAGALSVAAPEASVEFDATDNADARWNFVAPWYQNQQSNDAYRKAIEHAMKAMEEGDYSDHVKEALKQAMKQGQAHSFAWRAPEAPSAPGGAPGTPRMLVIPDAPAATQVAPGEYRFAQIAPGRTAVVQDRITELEEQIEDRIERLDRRIEKLTEAIEKLADR